MTLKLKPNLPLNLTLIATFNLTPTSKKWQNMSINHNGFSLRMMWKVWKTMIRLESAVGMFIHAWTGNYIISPILRHFYGCVQNCREIEIVERWKWVSEIVENYFPVKSSSQNLIEIEFVENMRVSFRNCREIWKQVSEIVEKGGFFNL